jgi:hypothetical protein
MASFGLTFNVILDGLFGRELRVEAGLLPIAISDTFLPPAIGGFFTR